MSGQRPVSRRADSALRSPQPSFDCAHGEASNQLFLRDPAADQNREAGQSGRCRQLRVKEASAADEADRVTIGAFRALRRMGLHQPVALIGFGDILLADLLEPRITVIAQDPAAIGRAAAQVLFRRLDGDRAPSEQRIVLTKLITRGSGEIAP